MSRRPVVVDGSNLATEGRSLPSLAQLDEAVRAWLAENPDDEVIVVVDASFGYRIDESERKTFEEAEEAGEVVSPPAGALGRGDGFLLRIADRVDAAVLSNDSFQEFHGDYPWLFDSGRLLGGKPVPGVGWIFTPRTPVRGPKSRMSVRDAKRSEKPARSEPVVEAIAEATAEAMEPEKATDGRRGRRRASGRPSASTHEAINDPLPFITFIAEHHLGTEVEGEVDSFTSHGAFVVADGARCYVPVSGLGDPPPRTAKAVLKKGEVRTFVVQALDPPRRGIELALPGLARVAGAPTEETVEAEIAGTKTSVAGDGVVRGRRRRGRRAGAPAPALDSVRSTPLEAGPSREVPADGAEPEGREVAAALPPAAGVDAPPPARRRRTSKKVAADAAAAVAADAAAPVVAEPEVPPPVRARRSTKKAAAPMAEPAPAEAKPPPRRRTAKKAAAAVEQPTPAEQPPAEEQPPPEEAKPAAGRRRSTKKAAAPQPPTGEQPPAEESKPARRRSTKKTAAEQPPAEEAKPARRRSTKKAAAQQPPATEQSSAEEGTAGPKPRRTTKKAASSTKKAAPKAAASAGAEPAPGEAQPPPARRRRTSKAGG